MIKKKISTFLPNFSFDGVQNKRVFLEEFERFIQYNCTELENMTKHLIDDFRYIPKIACFCEQITSTLMWAHYADYHRGFAIEYDFGDFYSDNHLRDHIVLPVIYSDKRYDATDLAFLNVILSYAYENNKEKIMFLGLLSLYKMYLCKGSEWQYEREWRSFLVDCTTDVNMVKYKSKAVYLGANISNNDRSKILKIAQSKNIPAFQMYIRNDQKGYILDKRMID